MNMRVTLAIALFVGSTAYANPIPVTTLPVSYITSEKLVATISSTDATIVASFTFWHPDQYPFTVDLPIWFPESGVGDPAVEKFWKTFARGHWYDLSATTTAWKVFDSSVGLSVHTSESVPSWLPDAFNSLIVPGPTKYSDDRGVLQEPGFCCLVVPLRESSGVVWNNPVNISYRQPLARSNNEAHFFYVPVFENRPLGIAADTNRYAITIEAAPDCSLTVSNGDQGIDVPSGHSVTIFPRHLQPIRAVSNPTSLVRKTVPPAKQ